jgi:hypothetical protein
MDGRRVPAADVDSYQGLENRSAQTGVDPSNGGSEGLRQGFDDFDELLTT